MNRHLLKAIFALLLLSMMPLGLLPSTAHAQSAGEDTTIDQAWFFARPDGSDNPSRTLAERADWMSLTRGHGHFLKELRAAGYQGEVIEYLIGIEVQGPGLYTDSSAACDSSFKPSNNTVAYNVGDFCTYVHPHESWFLHNGRGERLVYKRPEGRGYDYQMNPNSEGWRAFFRERALRDLRGDSQQAALGFNGIYFDNIPMRLYRHLYQLVNSDGTVREYSNDNAYRDAVVEFLAYQRAALRQHGKLWANLIDFHGASTAEYMRYIKQLDGYMIEAWGPGYVGRDRDEAAEEQSLQIAEMALAQGKELMALVQGQQGDHIRQRYGLASFLLINNGQGSYFRYAYNKQPYTNWWDYSNYDVALGEPKGARYRSGNGWRRDFECGYVTADLEKERGEIVQKSCNSDLPPPPPAAPPSVFELPGRIEAEDYAEGANGYHDTTDGNKGGKYRDDNVDIQSCSEGYNCHHVSHITKGEWLSYKVDAKWGDDYSIRLRIAAQDPGQRVRIEVDGRSVTGSWTLPSTGGWNNWETVSKRIKLSEGPHTIRVVAETGWFNLNYIDVEPAVNN